LDSREDSLGNLGAFLDGVLSVDEDLRLDNGDKSVGLADGSVPGEGVGGLRDRQLRGEVLGN
jgi:hypothetical protein